MLRRAFAILLGCWLLPCCGCLLVQSHQKCDLFPFSASRNQLVIHSDVPVEHRQRLVDELVAQRDLVNETLGLAPTVTPIQVYLYSDEACYEDFVSKRFPEMAARRAIFVGKDDELAVYAQWGDHVAEDLRHEVSHGYLHAAVPQLPLWLDEGLAEYFEVGPSRHGYNRAHVDMLAQQIEQGTWQPELVRLEGLHSAAEMTQQDYAESWAWVHFLLESPDKAEILKSYLADLQQGPSAEPLSTRIHKRLAVPQTALVEHVQMLR